MSAGIGPERTERAAPQDADTPGPEGTLLYLYCVLEAGSSGHQAVLTQTLPGLLPGHPLFAISNEANEAHGLVAVVSRVPAELFQEEPLRELLADLPRLAPLAMQHEAAIGRLRESADALVPITFGAVYRSPSGVVQLLHEGGPRLRRLLNRVRNREEWGVKLFVDPTALRAAAARSSPEVGRLSTAAAAAGPGRAYLLSRSREAALAAATERLAVDAAQAILQDLAGLSVEMRVDDLAGAPADASQSGQSGVHLFAKAAFLIERETVAAFHARAEELREVYATGGVALELSGPWAPYSFVRDLEPGDAAPLGRPEEPAPRERETRGRGRA